MAKTPNNEYLRSMAEDVGGELDGHRRLNNDYLKIIAENIGSGGGTSAVATPTSNGLMSSTDKAKLDGIAENANAYVLPTATETTIGGVKPDNATLTVTDGTLSAVTTQESDGSTAGPIATLTAKGHAEQGSTTGKNLLPNNTTSTTSGGVTFTVNADGSVTANGTATATAFFGVPVPKSIFTSGSSYSLSGCPANGAGDTYRVDMRDTAGGAIISNIVDFGSGVSFSYNDVASANSLVYNIRIGSGYVCNNLTFYPQIELGSTATPYEPYTGGAPSPSPDYPQEIQVVRGHEVSGKTGRYVSLEITHDGTTTTIPIPLPSRGWVAGLPDGTADTLTLDGAGKVTWERETEEVVIDENATFGGTFFTDIQCRVAVIVSPSLVPTTAMAGLDQSILSDHFLPTGNPATYAGNVGIHRRTNGGSEVMLSWGTGTFASASEVTAWLAENPVTVLYPLATPVTEEMGYVDLPTVPENASISIPELDGLGVRYHVSGAAAELAGMYYERICLELGSLRSDVDGVMSDVTALSGDVSNLSDGVDELTDVVADHDGRITRNAADISATRRALLVRDADGCYENRSVTAFLSAKFDGRLYGYSEPKTTATTVTKTGANAGVQNPTLGTAATEGASEYRDLGPFQWFAAKGHVDADGVPHVRVIRGVDSEDAWDACDDNVWSLRPVVWYSVDDSGTSVVGSVSDTWHSGLAPNPCAYLPDGTLRPYMLAPRYALGFEDGVGVSKSGLKGYGRDVSHNSLITKLDYANTGYSGKSVYEQWYDAFMSRMIYGTKDFQTVMQGCSSYNYQYKPTVAETGVRRVILSNANAANLVVGSTMMLGDQSTANTDRNNANAYNVFDGLVIESITTYDADNKAVNFATDATFDTDTGYLLSTAPWHSGSCDAMDWDGSPGNPQSGREVAFFQGCELITGTTEVLAGVILSNDGTTGWVPYVVHDTRDDATSLTGDFVSCGAALPTDETDSWKYPLYVSDHGGLMYGTTTGGSTTTGACDGHYTNKLSTVGIREWRSSGYLWNGRSDGPSCVVGDGGVGGASWSIWSRLSGSGRSRG